MGLTDDNVSRACQELNQAYKSHCSSHFVLQEELKHLTPAEIDNIMNNVTSLGIQIIHHHPNGLEVIRLAKGINKFMQLIQEALVRQVCNRSSIKFRRTQCYLSDIQSAKCMKDLIIV